MVESSPEFVQLITPEGERISNPELDPWVADVTDAQLTAWYEDMVVVRRIDTEATALQRQGELGLWPPLLGQEAAQVGSSRATRDDDFIFPSYRENAVAYVRGVPFADIVRVWRGNAQSGWDPYKHQLAAPNIIIGAQTLHAVGWGVGAKYDGVDSVAVTYFGDGATSEGDVNEAMVFAASFQAPVVFFCQNNHWAISEPVGLQAVQSIADRAPGFGIPSLRVDGNDVLAVVAATRLALDRARRGDGPTFIEAVTYRMGPHTTADDPTRYRDKAELEAWKLRDPILRLQRLLDSLGLLTPELEARTQAKADEVAAELRAGCINMPDPEPLTVFDNVYATPNATLEKERDQYAAYLSSFDSSNTTSNGGRS
ncbi:pyruvate dehydrogenase (acetyl-transferring) E1 component subunit alpha [Cryobacterium psychrophilum]|uniref:pyruvate dehydrogenase (acetyl-transferring) E1 component subunit alpha n=1 Tax=Cryobacterium psychrophilum TaxID=41988 RepID=UPI0010D6C334|nr:pyruvate dehydrogenase (acetyl-transferring) E1 component subunit alpha [Cryobacterium psychrophilum]TDW29054.1 pyruvate dehydrogenase E1 component alpha subunit [Cryobacterium psychrophilum]